MHGAGGIRDSRRRRHHA